MTARHLTRTKNTVQIPVERSDKWLREQQITRGINLEPTILVDVIPAELSDRAREIIIDRHGFFPELFDPRAIATSSGYQWEAGCPRQPIVIDKDSPTIDDVNEALLRADAELAADSARLAERNARAQAKWDDEERKKKEEKERLSAARKLLEREIQEWQREVKELREQRRILSEILAQIDPAAVIAAIKRHTEEELATSIDAAAQSLRAACTMPLWLEEGDE